MSYKSKSRWAMKRNPITTRDRLERYYREREYKNWKERNFKSYEIKRVEVIGDVIIYRKEV